MLLEAMEVSGTKGNVRPLCDNVMHVLHANKDTNVAMMEVYLNMLLLIFEMSWFDKISKLLVC